MPTLMEKLLLDYSSSSALIWDEKHLKALLRLNHHPIHLIQIEPWQTWIKHHGGFEHVLDYLRSAPFPPNQEEIFNIIVAHPNVSTKFYYSKLHISPSAYFSRLNGLMRTLLLQLNKWESELPKTPAKPAVPTNLPAALTSLIGAEKSLIDVATILQRPAIRLLTLTGPGGVGKTRLAMAAGAALLANFGDGVFFVPLETVTEPALLITQITRSLNIETLWGKSKSLLEVLKTHLREQRILLILDNFEQLIQSAGTVTELLQSTSNLKVLVTSREALNIDGEIRYTVSELPRPDPASLPPLEQLSQWPALDLFVQRVQARHPEFIVNKANLKTIALICHRLDGLPLAIELAAAQVRWLEPGQALPQLEYGLKSLRDTSRDRTSRQKTLWDAIDWSYQLLSETEKALFRRLAVFGREWSLEAAEIVCQTDDALANLESLADKSLVRYAQQSANDDVRFQMLQAVREYAFDQLASNAETEQTQRRHANYFLELVERAELAIGTPEQLPWMHRIRQERENLQLALHWMLDQKETEMALRLLGAAWRYYNMLNIWDETLAWMDRALAQDTHLKSVGRVKALWGASWLTTTSDDLARAMALGEEGLALAREIGDPRWIGLLLQNVVDGFKIRKEYDKAIPLLEESLMIFREMNDREEIAWVLYHIADTVARRGESLRGLEIFQESLAIFRAIGDQWGIGSTLWRVRVVALEIGDDTLAIEAELERQDILRVFGARRLISLSLNELAPILWQQGKFELLQTMVDESLALARESGYPANIGQALHFQGRLAFRRSDFVAAREFFEQARIIFEQIDDPALADTLAALEHLKDQT